MGFEITNWAIAMVTAGTIGLSIGRLRTMPFGRVSCAFLLVVAVFGLFVGKSVILVGVDNIRLYLGQAIFSGCVGAYIGSATHRLKLHRLKNA